MSREVIGEDGLGRGRLQLLMEVARLYYVEGMDQSAVARAVGYSRPAVSRFLTEARKRRIVRFTVGHPLEQVLELETKMKRAFGLAHVFVAGLTPDPAGA
ncbi:MAG: hypothetical protein LBH48_02155, partial [Bifidobacteriaceae bacterium]|nr:hypothetical protein [Bifidobacteriaceae bacterium]